MYQVKIKKLPNLPQARHGGNYLNYYQMAPSFTSKDLSDPGLEYVKNLNGVDRDLANVEAELGEEVMFPGPGGMMTKYGIGGQRHSAGGTPLNLPVGAFIFSDFHGKDFKLGGNKKTKVTDKGILDYFGLPERKGGYTFADISKKYDINKDIAMLMDPTEVKDKMTINTLEANIKNKTKKLGALAIAQESKKGEAAPKMAMPFVTALNMKPEDFDIPKIPLEEMPFYQNFMNAAQQMDQEQAMQAQESAGQSEDEMMQQYSQDMAMAQQRMGGSSFPNPYYPGRVPEEMPEAMLGYQVFRDGGETGLGRFVYKAQKGKTPFDFDNIVGRDYSKRRGVYIYTDVNGNEYESTQADLAIADEENPFTTNRSTGKTAETTVKSTPKYDIPKDAVVLERKKGESDEDWAKRKQEAFDKSPANVYIKSEDSYYKVGSRSKGYGIEYKGSEDELKKIFNGNKDLAAMYQKVEETFKDPKVRAEYVKYVRDAVKNDENLGALAKGSFKTKVLNGTITDDQIIQAFLDHNKRNIGFAAHGRKVADTKQKADLGYTNSDLDKWSKEMGLDIKKDNVLLEQLSYIGYRDFINNRDKIADADVKSKLAGFNVSQFGKNDEITALGEGQVSDADEYYTNTTAGQVAGYDPGKELYDEQLKAQQEAEKVPAGDFGTPGQRPPAQPWLQNLMGTSAALLQDVNRYMPIRTQVPYVAQVDPQFISPIYRSQQANATARGMMEGMAPYMGDQLASSRQSQLFGEVADKAAQAAASVEEFNAGQTDKSNQFNAQSRMQGAQAQAASDAEYATNVIGSKAIYDKNNQLKMTNILRNSIATIDNMMKTDAINYVYGDQFMIDPMSGGKIVQTSGKSPNGQLDQTEVNTILAAYKNAINNPDYSGLDPEDVKDLVIAQYNKNAYGSSANRRKQTLANSIMSGYMSPVGGQNPMMDQLSAYASGMNPYGQQ